MELYDPQAHATPLEKQLFELMRGRRARFAKAAKPEPKPQPKLAPIDLNPEPIPAPVSWEARQLEIHPPLKATWFSVEEELGPKPPPKIELIQKVCAEHYSISRVAINSQRRTANVVRPRQVGMFLSKELTMRSFPEIGRRFGMRDHTTVLHAVRKIGLLVEKDAAFAAEIEGLRQTIAGLQ